MPLEFRCPGCNRLLRVSESMAGRRAQCPNCNHVQVIPSPGEVASSPPAAPPADSSVPSGLAETLAGPTPPPPNASADQRERLQAQQTMPQQPQTMPQQPPGTTPFGGPQDGFPPGALQDFGPVNPYQTPSAYTGPAPMAPIMAGSGAIVPSPLDIGRALSSAWQIYKAELGMCIGVAVVMWAIMFVINLCMTPIQMLLVAAIGPIAVNFVTYLVSGLVQAWLGAGLTICMLKIARGQATTVGELFSGGAYVGRIFGAIVLIWIIVGLVALICSFPILGSLMANQRPAPGPLMLTAGLACVAIVAGAIVGLYISQYQKLIVDRNLGLVEALSQRFVACNASIGDLDFIRKRRS